MRYIQSLVKSFSLISLMFLMLLLMGIQSVYISTALIFMLGIWIFIVFESDKHMNEWYLFKKKYGKPFLFVVSGFPLICMLILTLFFNSIIGAESNLTAKEKVALSPNIIDQIKRNQLEEEYQSQLNEKDFEHIRFLYPEADEKSMAMVQNSFREADRIADMLFGKQEKPEVDVILYDDKNTFEKISTLESVVGFYSEEEKSIHLLSNKEMTKWELKSTIIHEYNHFRMDILLTELGVDSSNVPQWFQEGVAEYAGYGDNGPTQAFETVDFQELDTNQQFHQARKQNYDPYLQSYKAIKQLADMEGKEVILKILIQMKEDNFYEAFHKVTGMKINTYQEVFLESEKPENIGFES
ncbi:DUF2268 domain-containing putative Zn-dependent protease [Pseudalkalibacillus caeni]|uniref:Uncharacterized protein n=1 Tax=Exobacillus caeni TaxID=2574798 RepID=A0A5R9F0X2_9BACL|nr:DUF2268 domain-containing putative Zn-dependent protease [Pseudalkalibacillus caeni]TLS37282.1 hypothetical protein FCL54_12230 [Pseudalkalibacillus caeni]